MYCLLQTVIRILFFMLVVKPLLGAVLGMNVFNRRYLPVDRQCVVIANHNSHLDALALMNLFPLRKLHTVRPVAAEDYFMSNAILAWFSTTVMNIIPIPRTQITKTNNPLIAMEEALGKGQTLIIFPEGSRGEPEVIGEFKTGIAHLIKKHPELPVVPVFLHGLGKSLPRGDFLLVPFFCDVVIGAPLWPTGDKEAITAQVENAVRQLADQFREAYGHEL
jgi:1-acyl-sn-glycerol-3-phosphate acyltransferase